MSDQHCALPDKCGHPQVGAGHPRKGWIRTKVAGQTDSDRWWCSIRCLLVGFTQSVHDDVALCVACINRHDRGHKCAVCGTAPHVVQGAPTEARARPFANFGRAV